MYSRPPFWGPNLDPKTGSDQRRFFSTFFPRFQRAPSTRSDVAKHVGRNGRALPSLTTPLLRQLVHHHHNAHSNCPCWPARSVRTYRHDCYRLCLTVDCTRPSPAFSGSEASLLTRWRLLESPTWALPPLAIRLTRHDRHGSAYQNLRLAILYNSTAHADLPCPDERPMSYPKLLGSTRLHYYWSYVSTRTARPVAWLTHDGLGLRFYLRRSHHGVRSFLLPMEGDEPCRFRDFEARLLPNLAFFAL